jgi:hypothetical protein
VKRPVIFFDVTEEERDLIMRASRKSGLRSFNAWARAELLRLASNSLGEPVPEPPTK